ncbi:MAG TPA: NAD-dependent epimerase/dehydratase family protein [Blastocatellia bacterium]|nr:NAD-dependent epimerase/dehydratase family protein [Blastocatellia bacterium]
MSNRQLLDRFAGRDVLVTGGLGFIGSNLALRLVDLGARVTLMDSLAEDYGGNRFNIRGLEDRLRVVIADMRSEAEVEALVSGRDIIFNLAGQVSHIDSMNDPLTDLEINARAQLVLLEACRKKNLDARVIYTSTRQLYGRAERLPVDETHAVRPVDVNGINKFAGEAYHLLYHKVYGLPAVSLRLTNTYGPRQLIKHARQGFMGWFVRQIVEGREIELYGDGSQLRDLNYVDDVADALLLAAASDQTAGEVFNLGGNEPISLKELVELMIEINGGGSYRLVEFPPEKKGIDIGDFYGDFTKINRALGWRPKTSLVEGLRRTFDYYRENMSRYVKA